MASEGIGAPTLEMDTEQQSKKDDSPVPQENKKKKKQKYPAMILKDFPQNCTDEEKLSVLCEKLHESHQEQKNLQAKMKQYENVVKTIKQERDILQTERNRLVLQKDKLEALCRELQKQNKIIQEENLTRTRAEEEKRREVAEHFQNSISSIQTQLNEYHNRNAELRKENQDLADKLNEFIKQHEKREEHLQKIMQTRDLEVKLAEAKTHKLQCQLDQERVKGQQQLVRMEAEAKLMKERLDMHISVENKLKEQIEFYKNKYKSFNKTMADSNRLFDSAKGEMEKLGKRVHQAERDVIEWRGKWELSQRSLLELVEEHKKKTEEAAASRKQAERLAGLCRALQSQLLELRKRDPERKPTHGQGDGPVEDEEKGDYVVLDQETISDSAPLKSEVDTPSTSPVCNAPSSEESVAVNQDTDASKTLSDCADDSSEPFETADIAQDECERTPTNDSP